MSVWKTILTNFYKSTKARVGALRTARTLTKICKKFVNALKAAETYTHTHTHTHTHTSKPLLSQKQIGTICFAFIFSIFSISAFAANNCTGATYYDADSDTCIACPTGYDYNTTAGKTDITECQIHCNAGTYVSSYTQLEYIESTGTQYIDTEYIPTAITRTEIDLKFTGDTYASSGGNVFFGTTRYTANFGGNSNQGYKIYPWLCSYGTSSCAVASFDINASLKTTRQTFVFDAQNKIASYGTVSKSLSGQTQPSVPDGSIHLFGTLNSNTNKVGVYSRNAGMYIYETRIYEDGVLVRKFVPVRRNSDNVLGMYDTVTRQFFTNSGTGSFTGGPDTTTFIGGVICVDVGVGYYAGASTVNYGSTGTRTACPAGTYSSITNAASCTPCSGATYNDETAQIACKSCPEGYDYNTTSGKTSVSQCQSQCAAGTWESGYTKLEYLKSNGKQFIDTGFSITNAEIGTEKIVVDTMFLSGTNAFHGRGWVESTNYGPYGPAVGILNGYFHLENGNLNGVKNSITSDVPGNIGTRYLFTWDAVNQTYNVKDVENDTTVLNITDVPLPDDNKTSTSLGLFAQHYGNINQYVYNSSRVYGAKFYKNNVLLRDFIPVRRNSDGELGMYDLVNDVFYVRGAGGTNNYGATPFTAGPDVDVLCLDADPGYYATSVAVNYGSTGSQTACPVGTYNPTTNGASVAACLSCSGATYNDETAQTACKECPTRYDYNTTSGKTSVSQCQIQCPAGTWNGGYTQLEYIESTRTQYMLTNIPWTSVYRFRGRAQATLISGNAYNRAVVGSTAPTGTMYNGFYGTSRADSSGYWYWVSSIKPDTIAEFDIERNGTGLTSWQGTLNGVSTSRTGTTFGGNVVFMASYGTNNAIDSNRYFNGKVWYVQLFDENGNKLFDGIPARRNSDGVLGMYDAVNNVFYTNAGTGTFIAGPDGLAQCFDVGAGYWSAGGIMNFGGTPIARNACPVGTYTVGYGHGADEANDCGRILHLGDSVIYTRKNKPTTPALNIRMENGDMYYIGLSTTDHTVSRLHFQTGETKYTAFDDSLYYGERDYDTGEKITQ